MHFKYFLIALVYAFSQSTHAQEVPFFYQKVYSQEFSSTNALNDFYTGIDSSAWEIHPTHRYVSRIANVFQDSLLENRGMLLLDKHAVGDFTLKTSIHLGNNKDTLCRTGIVFGFNDFKNYYYLNLRKGQDSLQVSVYTITSSEKKLKMEKSFAYGKSSIQIGLHRDIVKKSIEVWINNSKIPQLTVFDRTLIKGYIGYISDTKLFRIYNLTVWAPASIPEKIGMP